MNILAAIDIQNLYYKFSMKSSKIDIGKLKQRIIDDVVTKENDNLELLAFFSIHHKGVGQDFKIMLEKYGYITHEKETFDKNKNMDVVIVNEIFKRLICDESSFPHLMQNCFLISIISLSPFLNILILYLPLNFTISNSV